MYTCRLEVCRRFQEYFGASGCVKLGFRRVFMAQSVSLYTRFMQIGVPSTVEELKQIDELNSRSRLPAVIAHLAMLRD